VHFKLMDFNPFMWISTRSKGYLTVAWLSYKNYL